MVFGNWSDTLAIGEIVNPSYRRIIRSDTELSTQAYAA